MGIEQKKIRAKIELGIGLTVETPFILSFNVNKSRGQIGTFSASLKVSGADVSGNLAGGSVAISAGVNSASTPIFFGIVKRATISPCFEDPSYVIINISGSDVRTLLDGKKYTRRSTVSKKNFVLITGARDGLRSGKFTYRPFEPVIHITPDNDVSVPGVVTAHGGYTLDNAPHPGESLTPNPLRSAPVQVTYESNEGI